MPRYIDLTHALKEGMQRHPSQPPVEFTQIGRIFMDHFHSTRVTFGTHTGSHVDSPSHMLEGAHPRADEIPLSTLIGPAKIAKFNKGAHEAVTRAELVAACGALEKGDRLLIDFGWSRLHWKSRKYFEESPFLAPDAAEYLVESGVALVAMDTPSPDCPDFSWDVPERSMIHKTLMRGGVIIVESLEKMEQIPDGEPFEIIILPLRAEGLDGFPVRAVAVCRE